MARAPALQTFATVLGVDDVVTIRGFMKDGEPWFVASDACKALGLKPHVRGGYNHHTAVLSTDEKVLSGQMSDAELFARAEALKAEARALNETPKKSASELLRELANRVEARGVDYPPH